MKQLVYIVSPEFSGSTAIDMLIGTLPGYVSGGELTDAFNQIHSGRLKTKCSCGADADDCPVWAKIKKSVIKDDLHSTIVRCKMLDRSL